MLVDTAGIFYIRACTVIEHVGASDMRLMTIGSITDLFLDFDINNVLLCRFQDLYVCACLCGRFSNCQVCYVHSLSHIVYSSLTPYALKLEVGW